MEEAYQGNTLIVPVCAANEILSSDTATDYEKDILSIVKNYYQRFFYAYIDKTIERSYYIVNVKKDAREMVGKATVYFRIFEKSPIDYHVMYNRIYTFDYLYGIKIDKFLDTL